MRQWIEDALWSWSNGWSFRFNMYEDNIDRLAFFEEINNGWYHMYIYPYDDMYMPIISAERKIRLSEQPYTYYVSQQDYDILVKSLEEPPKPSQGLIDLMNRKTPWDDDETTT